jgi:anti-sigma-K factor RskA
MADDSRPFTEDALLDFVRGSGSADLSRGIEAAMADDPSLRAEVALMRGLGPALKAETGYEAPVAFGWRRLQADIARETTASPAPRRDTRRVVFWRAAAAVLAVAALGEAAYIATRMATPDATYRTASDPAGTAVLGIVLAPDAKAADVEALLKRTRGRLVDGPGALGLYRVAFASREDRMAGRALFEASPLIDLVAEE